MLARIENHSSAWMPGGIIDHKNRIPGLPSFEYMTKSCFGVSASNWLVMLSQTSTVSEVSSPDLKSMNFITYFAESNETMNIKTL